MISYHFLMGLLLYEHPMLSPYSSGCVCVYIHMRAPVCSRACGGAYTHTHVHVYLLSWEVWCVREGVHTHVCAHTPLPLPTSGGQGLVPTYGVSPAELKWGGA